MKKYRILLLTGLVIFTLFTWMCKKQFDDPGLSGGGGEALAPLNIPTYSGLSFVVPHMKHLAFCLAAQAEDDQFTTSPFTYFRENIAGAMAANADDEIFMQEAYDRFKTAGVGFTGLMFPHDDLYDNLKEINTSLNASGFLGTTWDSTCFFGFNIDQGGTITKWDIKIVMNDAQNQYSTNSGLPILVMVDNLNGQYPIEGYIYNPVTNGHNKLVWQDDQTWDNWIDANEDSYLIWIVSAEPDENHYIREKHNCEGDFIVGDNYCDETCGETIANSPNDCDPEHNRTVTLEQFQIRKDIKNKYCGDDCCKPYYERYVSGKYEVAFSSMTIHANGKHESVDQLKMKPDVKRRHVKKENNNGRVRGTYRWVTPYEKKGNKNERPVICTNFNPETDKIYLSLFEYDPYTNGGSWRAPGINDDLHYTARATKPFASRKVCTPTAAYYKEILPSDLEFVADTTGGIGTYTYTWNDFDNGCSFKIKVK